jgi:hypothetical protein
MHEARLQDQLEITRAIQLIARAYDEKRHREILPQVFEPNAKQHYYFLGNFVDFSMPKGIEVTEYYHLRCYATQHVVSPPVIEFEGNTARTTSAVHAVHVQILADGSRSNWLLGGYYLDLLVKGADGWRIRERVAQGTYENGTFHEDARQFPTLPDYTKPA